MIKITCIRVAGKERNNAADTHTHTQTDKKQTVNEKPKAIMAKISPKFGGRDFPGGAVFKNPPANSGDTGSSPGPGRSHVPRSN